MVLVPIASQDFRTAHIQSPQADSGYVFTPISQSVTVNGNNISGLNFLTAAGCPTCSTIWTTSAAPVATDSGDSNATEVGVKIHADNDGYITGLRFYKSSSNTGTHQAHVWTTNGTQLGTATFTNEGVSGWQQVMFSAPIPVVANTTYIASYFAPAGHYSADLSYFATGGVDSPPLHALGDGVDGPNGVYAYTQTGGFPATASQATNFWVDAIYSSGNGYSILGTVNGPGAAGATITLSGSGTGSTVTDANGNYSLNGLQNGSYTVTPSNAGFAFTPASQPVTISGRHALDVNFASVQTYSISGAISGTGGAGATLTLSGDSTGATTADGLGNYTFTGLVNGNYVVTPSNAGFVFTPSSQSVTLAGASQSALNFSSSPTLSSITVNPSAGCGREFPNRHSNVTGAAPPGGIVVSLSSANPAAAQVRRPSPSPQVPPRPLLQ